MKNSTTFLFLSIFFLFISCKKMETVNDTNINSSNPAYDLVKNSLTVPPFDTADITGLVPLGNLNPPGHTFPTDHMYLYCFTNKSSLDIKSPGNIHIVRIGRTHYNVGTAGDHYDYNIAMGSDNSFMYWGHVSSLSARLLTAVNNFIGVKCDTAYSTGGSTYQQCFIPVSLSATPGEVLGIANTNNGLAGMDLGVTVNNLGANPLDYFDAAARAMMEPKLGSFDGRTRRTVPPICGEFLVDKAGTAQGNWFRYSTQKGAEDNNIALVPDNVIPSQLAFSVGNSIPGLKSGVYYFDIQNTGLINRKFTDVLADGNAYCYTLGYPNFPNTGNSLIPNISIIVKLENANSLSIEKRNCDCSCIPYTFSPTKVSFIR
jgi:hypothetical protein